MKKILFAICFIATAQASLAQAKFGVKAGVNISNQLNAYTGTTAATNPLLKDGNSVLELNGGIFTEIAISEKFRIRPQLGVSNGGYKAGEIYDQLGNLIMPETRYRLNYLHIPVHALYTMKFKSGTAWVGAGPYAAFLVSGTYKTPSGSFKINIGNKSSDQFKPMDFGISGALGLTLDNGILIGIEPNIGLADATSGEGKSKNMIWSFYIGFVIK